MCQYVDLNMAHKCYLFTDVVHFLFYALTMFMSLNLKFFNSYGIKAKILYTSKIAGGTLPNR